MQPVNVGYCNTVFSAPEGQDHIQALHVQAHRENGEQVLTSYWKPSEEELALLMKGSAVMLSILDDKHPAVKIEVSLDPLTI